jgi:hypothetical protein
MIRGEVYWSAPPPCTLVAGAAGATRV